MSFDRENYKQVIARLRATGAAIVPLEECYKTTCMDVISIRHDVDGNLHAAGDMARMEGELGIRSTYFLLDTAHYWGNLFESIRFNGGDRDLNAIKAIGPVGWHNNALAVHFRTGKELRSCIEDPLRVLRSVVEVTGTASHGDPTCYTHKFLNYSVFRGMKQNDNFPYKPLPQFDLADFGLLYEAYHTGHTHYISDSGGEWSGLIGHDKTEINDLLTDFEHKLGREPVKLQVLIHPQWWSL